MVKASGTIRRILVDNGLITAADWTAARDSGRPILDALIERGTIEEAKLIALLARSAKVPPVDLSRAQPDTSAVQTLPQEVCMEHTVLPLAKNGEIITVAVADPFDVLLLDDLTLLAGAKIRPVLALPGAIKAKLADVFDHDKKQVDELLGEVTSGDLEVKTDEGSEDLTSIAAVSGDDVPAV